MKTYEITDTKIENKACYLVIKGKKEAFAIKILTTWYENKSKRNK